MELPIEVKIALFELEGLGCECYWRDFHDRLRKRLVVNTLATMLSARDYKLVLLDPGCDCSGRGPVYKLTQQGQQLVGIIK